VYQSGEVESNSLLSVNNLTVQYQIYDKPVTAVDHVALKLFKGRIHALVGESGCGKSTLGLSLSRLFPEKRVLYSGSIIYKGTDILSLSERDMQYYRGTEISTIFQEPMTALNPVYTIGEQIAEAIALGDHRRGKKRTSIDTSGIRQFHNYLRSSFHREFEYYLPTILDLLNKVRIINPQRVARMYPHELSGGMRQRVMIAMSLAQQPSLLVADEATTAVDVTTQVQILGLLRSLTDEFNMATLLITHDLGLVSAVADRVSVMYAGRIVEEATTEEIFESPKHPYTIGLLDSLPKGRKDNTTLTPIPGVVPPIGRYPTGCRFRPRCSEAFENCAISDPSLFTISDDHTAACFLYGS
jgi:peptide/nickel transport system ATP-binding protein